MTGDFWPTHLNYSPSGYWGNSCWSYSYPSTGSALSGHLVAMDNPTWQTKDGREIPLCDLEDGYLRSIERFLRGEGEQKPKQGRSTKRWLLLIRDEMSHRGLDPSPPFPSLADAIRVLNNANDYFSKLHVWATGTETKAHVDALGKVLPALRDAMKTNNLRNLYSQQ